MAIQANPDEVIGRKGVSTAIRVRNPVADHFTGARCLHHSHHPGYPDWRGELQLCFAIMVSADNLQYEGTPAGDGNVVVSKLADYLKSVGY